MKIRSTFILVSILWGCTSDKEASFVDQVETAHAKTSFLENPSVQFDLQLFFGGQKQLDARITTLTNSGKIRMDIKNGVSLFFDGNDIYQTPANVNYPGARFDILTWSYFFLFPYKLSDPGTRWLDYPNRTLNGQDYLVKKLTFEENIGDSPDDWYVVYVDPEKQRIRYAAYIITLYKSQQVAEEDPHAIEYTDYRMVNNIPIAHQWTFWEWRENEPLGKKLGTAKLSQIQFKNLSADFYKASQGAKKITLE